MFDLSALFKRAGKVAAENSPAILTAIGVTGTLTTAYFAAKGAFKAAEVIREAENERCVNNEECLTTQEKVEVTWKLYVPAAASAAMTVAAIICANRISERRTAALASAYSVAQNGIKEYREKVVEKVGKKKEQEITDEVAADRIRNAPPSTTEIFIGNGGSTLCYDRWSGRYFAGDIESVRSAVNDFNAKVINETYASLNEFWELVGLPSVTGGSELGWNTDRLLEVDYSWVTVGDDRIVHIDFRTLPIARYDSGF
uniref:Uncharacterized protein n=1 Tax=Streptomyces phage Scarif TaxID=3158858 RepID=A0AAU7GXP3_9CAUD